MDIVAYLLELIETRKIIGINALGTLYKKKTPGRYDSDTRSFLPPKYEIAFTTEVKEDQELVKFISEKKNITIESANYYITEFVEKINAQLADHQQADFSPLGELKLINDEIVLESSNAVTVGFDFYGLPSVSTVVQTDEQTVYDEISEVNNDVSEIVKDEEVTAEKETPDEKEESAITKPEEPVLENDNSTPKPTQITDPLWRPTVISRYEYEDDDDDENKGRGKRLFLKIALILLLIAAAAVGAIYLLLPDLYNSFKDDIFSKQIESEPTVVLDTNSNHKIDSAVADSVTKITVAPNVAPKDSVTTTTSYEVIESAMKTEKKANEVISKLAKRGITAKRMEALPGRLIKVSIGTFTDYNLAKKFQDSLKIKLRNPDIYIQTIKPKN